MRIVGRIVLGLAALLLLAVIGLYGGSEYVIRRGHAAPLDPISVPADPASIVEGARLARIMGCRGCHGAEGQGAVMVDDPMLGRLAPPPFARVNASYTDAQIARAVRYGVRNDGSALFIMPAHAHRFISDDDMGRIIAWMRTIRPGPNDSQATMRWGPVARGLVLAGMFPSSVQSGDVSEPARPANAGRYWVDSTCSDCHSLTGERTAHDDGRRVPALAGAAAAYDFAQFRRLLQTGVGLTPRDLGLMRIAALDGYSAMSETEMRAIYDYLKAEAARQ